MWLISVQPHTATLRLQNVTAGCAPYNFGQQLRGPAPAAVRGCAFFNREGETSAWRQKIPPGVELVANWRQIISSAASRVALATKNSSPILKKKTLACTAVGVKAVLLLGLM